MNTKPISAIIVEDDEAFRLLLKTLLETKGVSIVGEADNGQDGVNLYKQTLPDVVFMDIRMPVMDGITALREIRRIDSGATVIILTTLNDHLVKPDCEQSGAKDFVQKDMPPDIFGMRLDSILKNISP